MNLQEAAVEALTNMLSKTYQLYLKTHLYHWNVTGKDFFSLHLAFEQQYTELWNTIDILAETLRGKGVVISLAHLSIPEGLEETTPEGMVKDLLSLHKELLDITKNAIPIAEEAKDAPLADLFTQRASVHEKTIWMLSAYLSS